MPSNRSARTICREDKRRDRQGCSGLFPVHPHHHAIHESDPSPTVCTVRFQLGCQNVPRGAGASSAKPWYCLWGSDPRHRVAVDASKRSTSGSYVIHSRSRRKVKRSSDHETWSGCLFLPKVRAAFLIQSSQASVMCFIVDWHELLPELMQLTRGKSQNASARYSTAKVFWVNLITQTKRDHIHCNPRTWPMIVGFNE